MSRISVADAPGRAPRTRERRGFAYAAPMRRLHVLDTTLRDGALTPGVELGIAARVAIARALDAAGVDVIEAGFPARSPVDRQGLDAVVGAVERATVCALCRADAAEIDVAGALLARAPRSRLHLFAGGATRQVPELVEQAARAVTLARSAAAEVQFSPLDSTRLEPGFLAELVRAVVDAGATIVGLTDTLGVALPEDVSALIGVARAALPAASPALLSFHGHDDLGLATACALAAVAAGASQLEVCVNGLGPRAGNTALEQIVAVVARHGARLGVSTGVEAGALRALSATVAAHAGVAVAASKAIVGEQATLADLDALLG
jgi:2-isopropylmalate synthase